VQSPKRHVSAQLFLIVIDIWIFDERENTKMDGCALEIWKDQSSKDNSTFGGLRKFGSHIER
jgi:hypothetical protein